MVNHLLEGDLAPELLPLLDQGGGGGGGGGEAAAVGDGMGKGKGKMGAVAGAGAKGKADGGEPRTPAGPGSTWLPQMRRCVICSL